MISTLLLAAVAAGAAPPRPAAPEAARPFPSVRYPSPADDPELDERLEAAGDDVEKLWNLVLWCEDTDREESAAKVLRAIVRIHPDHRAARLRLGHLYYDGRWFASERQLESYKQEELDREAEARGLVKHRGEWVHPGDVPMLEKGLVKGPDGRWITSDDARRVEHGWVRQDLVWVAPDELDRIDEGLWKCGEEWLPLAEANVWHRTPDRCWVVPAGPFTVWTTCDRALLDELVPALEEARAELVRVWGATPPHPLPVLVLREWAELKGLETQGLAGFGPASGLRQAELLRASFLESWHDAGTKTWLGMGATFWDAGAERGGAFGPHDLRLALGLSFADAVDPSRRAVARLEENGPHASFVEDFYEEKRAPDWFRWGSACYVARFYRDGSVGAGGDPWWVREWSLGDLSERGGASSLQHLFRFEMGRKDVDGWRLVLTAGLVVAFVVDGDCAPVAALHAELREALAKGADPGKIFERLRRELQAHEPELRAFAGR